MPVRCTTKLGSAPAAVALSATVAVRAAGAVGVEAAARSGGGGAVRGAGGAGPPLSLQAAVVSRR